MLLALAALLSTLQATAPSTADLIGPADRWTTFGGNPARTANCRTAPLRGPVAIAWTHDAGAKIIGEPLVWDEMIVLELESGTKSGTNRRSLRFLDLLSGEALTSRDHSVTSEVTLEPGIWRNEVLLRKSPTSISGLRMWRGRMYERWSHRTEGEVGPPLLMGGEVYACVGDSVERMSWGRNVPVWRTEGAFRGRVTLTDRSVIALRVGPDRFLHAVEMSRDNGQILRSAAVGAAQVGITHADSKPATLALLGDAWAISVPPPRTLIPSQRIHGILIDPSHPQAASDLAQIPAGGRWTDLPAYHWGEADKAGWVGVFTSGKTSLLQTEDLRSPQLKVLATQESNADFATHQGGATVLEGVTYAGPRAFDQISQDVLWRQEPGDVLTGRAIPARDSVLYVRNETELVALRGAFQILAGSAAQESTSVGQEGDVPKPFVGQLLLRDGSRREGLVTIDERAAELRVAAKADAEPEIFSSADVLVGLDDEGHPVWAKGGRALARGLRTLGEDERAERLGEIALESKRRRDPDLVEAFLERAWQAGSENKKLDKLVDWIERARKSKSTSKKSDEAKIAALHEEADRADGAPRRSVLQGYAALDEASPFAWRIALLRSLLDEDPRDSEAAAWVRQLLDPDLRPGAGSAFDAIDWLRFIEATYHAPVTIHQVPAKESADLTFAERQLGRAATLWREDVVAFESENLLVLTAVERPGAIARCLAFGELVSDVLESIFASEAIEAERKDRAVRNPLVLYLYPTREEYMKREGGKRPRGEEGAGLEWSAGHYDEIENVSRIFVPPGDAELESVLRTYVHELTHHWLRVKCPLFTNAEAKRDPRHAGFWIVEGFASMVEEFLFDPATQRWSPENPQSKRLDLVANTEEGQRLPWDRFFAMNQLEFLKMPFKGQPLLPSSTRLGVRIPVSPRNIYYAQAAATARYLFLGEEGKYRGAMCDFLHDVYVGDDTEGLDICARIGLKPEELGGLVLEFAREAVGKN